MAVVSPGTAATEGYVSGWTNVGIHEVDGPPWPEVMVTDDLTVRLVRAGDDRIVAVQPTCPHLGSPLTRAEISGTTLECPFHWYAFDLATGQNLHPGWDDCSLRVHAAEVRGGEVWVRLGEPS